MVSLAAMVSFGFHDKRRVPMDSQPLSAYHSAFTLGPFDVGLKIESGCW